MLLVREKKPHRASRSWDVHRRWPNAFFEGQGLYSLTTAFALAVQSARR
jgi:hypothetical protein